jgi:hypothetical protein
MVSVHRSRNHTRGAHHFCPQHHACQEPRIVSAAVHPILLVYLRLVRTRHSRPRNLQMGSHRSLTRGPGALLVEPSPPRISRRHRRAEDFEANRPALGRLTPMQASRRTYLLPCLKPLPLCEVRDHDNLFLRRQQRQPRNPNMLNPPLHQSKLEVA